MREGHSGKAQQIVGTLENRRVEAKRAADDELDVTGAMQSEAVDFGGQLLTGELLAFDGQGDDERIVTDIPGDAFAFLRLDLAFQALARVLRRLLIRHFHDVELAIPAQPFRIFRDGVSKILLLDLADGDKRYFQLL